MKVELLSITSNAEKVIENAGRTSYLSFNKSNTESEKKFIKMLIKKKHFSVLEHAYAAFRISGVSRAFTHQLVRHRICSFIQQSQRYVNEKDFRYIEPNSIKSNTIAHKRFIEFIEKARIAYKELQKLGIKNEDARFVLPNAVESQIVISANLREWRHIFEVRGNLEAQWEIRYVVIEILKILEKLIPTPFLDFIINDKEKFIIKLNSIES